MSPSSGSLEKAHSVSSLTVSQAPAEPSQSGNHAGNISISPLDSIALMESNHQLHETRSLRMHRMVADRFYLEPAAVVQLGLNNLEQWRQRGVDCDDFTVWTNLLEGPPDRIFEALTSVSEEAVRLRQSSPFAGLIPEEARRHILES